MQPSRPVEKYCLMRQEVLKCQLNVDYLAYYPRTDIDLIALIHLLLPESGG